MPSRSKPPLITPSASPQPPPFSSRLSDHPSPSKRQRRDSSKSRTQTPVSDLRKEREASTLRLLDVWASLAERYSRHMDDDDLVDIRTGEIIRDNGVLRNAPALQFGTLAAPVGEVNEVEDEEDEYDFDELDAFETTTDTDEEAKSELDTGGLTVPPATLIDQSYADDLREFLEAEKIRKEQCGTDADEDPEDQRSIREDSEHNTDDVVELEVVRAEKRLVRNSDKLKFPPRDDEDDLRLLQGQGTYSEPIVVTSDDELDFWKVNNSNAVRIVPKAGIPQHKNARASKPRQLHTPPRSQSSSRLSVSPLTTKHSDTQRSPNPISDSDFSGDDSSPSGRHRKKAHLKHRNAHVKPASPQSPDSMAHSSAKILRRNHLPHTTSDRGNDPEIPSVPSTKGSMTNPRKRPVVLLTPRKALKQLAKHADGQITHQDEGPRDDLPEMSSSRRLSGRKCKAKEWDDMVAATPDKYSTGRKVKIPLHTGQYVIGTELDKSARQVSSFTQIPKGADVVEASPKRPGKHPHPHSLKRKWDSYSTVDVSEVTMESPTLSTTPFLRNTEWCSREPRTDSDSEYDEPIPQQVRRKRSASCVATQVPPHFPHTYATPNHQNHDTSMFTPIPDPRAQLIIAQAVQQLSALVTGVWQPPAPHYLAGSSPRTPQRRSMSVQPLGSLRTPPHPHMYPLYDPAFSAATLPPESPEQEHYSTTSRRSLVSSHSHVRKVTFQLSDEESDTQEEVSSDTHRTPTSNRRSMNATALSKRNSETDNHGSRKGSRRRGQTPGPSSNFHHDK